MKSALAVSMVCGMAYLAAQTPPQAPADSFVGSASCQRCHAPIYDRWKQTRMANVVRDPRQHPEAIVADFTTPNPLVTFSTDQIAFVYGSKFKQRISGSRATTTSRCLRNGT
jgi:hypothetical protein